MPQTDPSTISVRSARPEMTADLMGQTGLDEALLFDLVHHFYEKVRMDALFGPIFAERISDWEPHLERMVAFWTSVTLMTGHYHGRPVSKHVGLPVTRLHYDRWLALFRDTATEICSADGATYIIERAERIAQALFAAGQANPPEQDACKAVTFNVRGRRNAGCKGRRR